MKKVGLAVVTYKDNFGSALQTYATQYVLNSLGYKTGIFDITGVHKDINKKKIVYYNCERNEFSLSENDNLSLSDKLKIAQKENSESIYNRFMKEINFNYNVKYSENDYMLIDKRINDCYANFNNKINFENEKIIMELNLKNLCSVFANFDFVYKDFDLINQINYN